MIPKDCKRLAEVDFPIAEVSRHAAREKATPPGHPSRLHLWWARRPLASSRAVLLALLWPDPCDPLCPEQFKGEARNIAHRCGLQPGHYGRGPASGATQFHRLLCELGSGVKPHLSRCRQVAGEGGARRRGTASGRS